MTVKAAHTPACPHTWNEGDTAFGCVLTPGHKGDHSPFQFASGMYKRTMTHINHDWDYQEKAADRLEMIETLEAAIELLGNLSFKDALPAYDKVKSALEKLKNKS